MCEKIRIPSDDGFLEVPAGTYANKKWYVDFVLESDLSPYPNEHLNATALEIRQGWINSDTEYMRSKCESSDCYSHDILGDVYDPDHVPGCPEFVKYPLPQRVYHD